MGRHYFKNFESVLRQVKAKYILGLTATPTRKDGHRPITYMQCGPVRFFLSPKKAAKFSLATPLLFGMAPAWGQFLKSGLNPYFETVDNGTLSGERNCEWRGNEGGDIRRNSVEWRSSD